MTLEARVRANAARLAALLDGADGSRRIPGMDWTVGEAGAHVVDGARRYVELLKGVPSDITDVNQTVVVNAEHLAAYTERDPSRLAADLAPAIDEMLVAYSATGAETVLDWHLGAKVRAADTLGIFLGELLVHGWDIAQGAGRPWTIDPADANAVLTAGLSVAPIYVDPAKSTGLNGLIKAKLRGGTTVGLRWTNGVLSVEDEPGKADCTVSAEPVAFLLTSYGRGSKWRPILTGKVVAYGRKPMLAMSLQKSLRSP